MVSVLREVGILQYPCGNHKFWWTTGFETQAYQMMVG